MCLNTTWASDSKMLAEQTLNRLKAEMHQDVTIVSPSVIMWTMTREGSLFLHFDLLIVVWVIRYGRCSLSEVPV